MLKVMPEAMPRLNRIKGGALAFLDQSAPPQVFRTYMNFAHEIGFSAFTTPESQCCQRPGSFET